MQAICSFRSPFYCMTAIAMLATLLSYVEIKNYLNTLTTNAPQHIETSQLICNVNQLTGFYMIGNIVR